MSIASLWGNFKRGGKNPCRQRGISTAAQGHQWRREIEPKNFQKTVLQSGYVLLTMACFRGQNSHLGYMVHGYNIWQYTPNIRYISLSDCRPLRRIYSYPVFPPLRSLWSAHETEVNINLCYYPTGGSACVQMRLDPSYPILSITIGVWVSRGTLDPVHPQHLPRKWSDNNTKWLILTEI
jgi:hypothetical protein